MFRRTLASPWRRLTLPTAPTTALRLEQAGILITGVAAGTDAAQRGVVTGDVILRIDSKTVSSPGDVKTALDVARADKRDFVVALIQPKVSTKPGPEWVALRVTDD